MSNLRTLSNEQIRRYHKGAYRPDNMAFIVSGMVDLVLLHSRSNAHCRSSRRRAFRATPRERCSASP